MTSVPHLFVPSLTGCVLVASMVFSCPAVSDALARPRQDGVTPPGRAGAVRRAAARPLHGGSAVRRPVDAAGSCTPAEAVTRRVGR